jgi:cation/acetate symporter
VAQFCVLIFAYMVPAFFLSFMLTGTPIPQIGLGSELNDGSGMYVLEKLDNVLTELGFNAYTAGQKSTIDMFCITMALMVGTAGLPHVIVRFFTVPKASDARKSAGWALVFIALLYTTAPAVGAFGMYNFINKTDGVEYSQADSFFTNREEADLLAWQDKNGDGVMQYRPGAAFEGKPEFTGETGPSGERVVANTPNADSENEVYVDRDIMVLANPEIANLPGWVVALMAAGGLAAALSTAAGLLLVISSSVSHDLLKSTFAPNISAKGELLAARLAATAAILVAGYLGIYPPGWVAQVVAFAFGLAASSLFPAIFMGIFFKAMNKEGAIAGMVSGLVFTFTYILYFKLVNPAANVADNWLFGISPEGIGVIGMLINFGVAIAVASVTAGTPVEIRKLVDSIRVPRGAGEAHAH